MVEVGSGQIPRERVGREGDRQRQRRRQKKENKGQTDRKKTTKRVQLQSQPEQGRQCGQSEVLSETEEGVSEALNSKTALFPDMILNIFCIKRVQRTHSASDSCLAL